MATPTQVRLDVMLHGRVRNPHYSSEWKTRFPAGVSFGPHCVPRSEGQTCATIVRRQHLEAGVGATGCPSGRLQGSPELIPEGGSPRFWHRLNRFRHFIDGSLAAPY